MTFDLSHIGHKILEELPSQTYGAIVIAIVMWVWLLPENYARKADLDHTNTEVAQALCRASSVTQKFSRFVVQQSLWTAEGQLYDVKRDIKLYPNKVDASVLTHRDQLRIEVDQLNQRLQSLPSNEPKACRQFDSEG